MKIVNLEFYITHNYDSKVKKHKYTFGRKKKKTEFTLHHPLLEREERKKGRQGREGREGRKKSQRNKGGALPNNAHQEEKS